jgi:hypothetical protein
MSFNTNKVYLLIEREFILLNKSVYKIGKTKQSNFKRFNTYPKGSELLFYSACCNCSNIENKIIKLFLSKYKQRKDIGTEYFEGDYKQMLKDMNNIIANEELKDNEHDIEYLNKPINVNNEETQQKINIKSKAKSEYNKKYYNNKKEKLALILKSNKSKCKSVKNITTETIEDLVNNFIRTNI